MNARSRLVLLACAALLLAACTSARRSQPVTGQPPPAGPELSEGRRAFMHHCHECHPGGDAGLGPAINNKPLPAGLIKFQVRQGLGVMPAFDREHLGDAELDAIAAYLIALRQRE